jgi:endonuclease/exonuclease/phosphatase (EEP) superfamily protein YafD
MDAELVEDRLVPWIRGSIMLGERRIELLNVHTIPPITGEYFLIWEEMFRDLARMAINRRHPLIVAGDLNATRHNRVYSLLADARLMDAHVALGRSSVATFPNGSSFLPDLQLDYVLYSPEWRCVSIAEGVGEGSDHKPLIADLVLDTPARSVNAH